MDCIHVGTSVVCGLCYCLSCPGVSLGCRSRAGRSRGFVALLRTASVRFLGRPLSGRRGFLAALQVRLLREYSTTVGRLPCRSVLILSLSFSLTLSLPLSLSLSLSISLSISLSRSLVCQSVSFRPTSARAPRSNCDLPFSPPHGVSQSRQKSYLLR